jgi:quercetin dioxygenase-like cupin family protein
VFSGETHNVGGETDAQAAKRAIWAVGWVLFWLAVLG